MFRVALCLGLLASAAAKRIQVDKSDETVKSRAKFGASCEDLQSTFNNRVDGIQVMVNAHPDDTTFNAVTRARFTMRTVGVLRVLRRARTCSWVVDNDGEDLEQMRGIAQVMLAGNSCAQAARAELQAGASDDATTVRRALEILVSENCEATVSDEEDVPFDVRDEEEVEAEVDLAEEQAQETADELMESAAMGEESNSAFIEINRWGIFGGIWRTLGVIFLFMLLFIVCLTGLGWAAMFLTMAFQLIVCRGWCNISLTGTNGILTFTQWSIGVFGLVTTGTIACAHQIVNEVVPRFTVEQ